MNTTNKKPKISPREQRAIDVLTGMQWIPRESMDRITGSSNGPDVISKIRKKICGEDGLDTRMVKGIDRDGRKCETGQYRLNEIGLTRINAFFGSDAIGMQA